MRSCASTDRTYDKRGRRLVLCMPVLGNMLSLNAACGSWLSNDYAINDRLAIYQSFNVCIHPAFKALNAVGNAFSRFADTIRQCCRPCLLAHERTVA